MSETTKTWWVEAWLRGFEITMLYVDGEHTSTNIIGTEDAWGSDPTSDEVAELEEFGRLSAALLFHRALDGTPRNAPVVALAESTCRICEQIDDPEVRNKIRAEANATARTMTNLTNAVAKRATSFKASGYEDIIRPVLGHKAGNEALSRGQKRLAEISEEIGMEIADVMTRDITALSPEPVYADGCGADFERIRTVIFQDGTIVPIRDSDIFDGGRCICLCLPEGQYDSLRNGKMGIYEGGKHLRDATDHEVAAQLAVEKLFPRYGTRM